ncbi:MAG: DUF2849 domain-containing protein [Pseudomonadota bacterium]
MAKAFKPVVFTANDLIEGDTVYLAATGWTRDVRAAAVAHDEAGREAMAARAAAAVADTSVVGPYDVEVGIEAGGPWPLRRREQIKASRQTTIPVGPAAQPAAAA